ncbi:MAG TPA: ATP-binding protein [Candidatus Binatia bacterium]|nr:ATP-binding protein [Candidatus Binatia bacterium]
MRVPEATSAIFFTLAAMLVASLPYLVPASSWVVVLMGIGAAVMLLRMAALQDRRRRISERETEERLRIEARLHMITDTLPVLVAYVDTFERYRFVNGTYREWLGQTPGSIEGRTMRDVLGEAAYERLRPHARAALAGERQSFTSEIPYRTGPRHVRVEYVPHRVDGRIVGFVSHVSDVSEAAQAAQERIELLDRERSARNEAETLNRIGRSLTAELETEKLVQLITDESTRITGAEFGAFFRNAVDERGAHYLLHTLSGAMRDHFAHLPSPRKTPMFAATFDGTAPVRLDDVRKDPRFGRNPPYNGLPSGHLPVVSYLAVPVISASGEVFGGLFFGHSRAGVFTDQHERIVMGIASQASIALDNARLYEAAKEADRRKDEFLAMLAHELRNPLSPIVASLQVMRLDDGAEAQSHARDVIERQVQRMVRLIDDLLDVSRITRGKIQLRREIVDLRRLAEQAVEATRSLMTSRSHRLHVTVAAQPVPVLADPVRIEQVLTNLLDNAAKYTEPSGDIWLDVRVQNDRAVAEVRDTGIGIPPSALPSMFDLFAQAERTLDRAAGGLGIGLTLVRRLVELHEGSIEASSDGVGKGSRFVMRLPLSADEAAVAVPDRVMNSDEDVGRSIRVLVVDDNPDITVTFSELLRTLGHDVRTADSGPAALDAARAFAPQLILLDLGLPGMSGYEVAQRLRRQPETAGARIVAVSGYAQDGDRERSRKAGFDEHLAKPVDLVRFRQILAEI